MKILVLGDEILDRYYWTEAQRLCPESCAPVLHVSRETSSPGGAALVHANLVSLGGNEISCCYGSFGEKHRIFAGRTLISRIDKDSIRVTPESKYWQQMEPLVNRAEAIVVGDYCKGAMGPMIASRLAKKGKPLFVDTKDPSIYREGFALFPNQREKDSRNFSHIVRKLGEHGCELDGVSVPTKEQQVYDVTGAGDVFMAAFVWAWSKGANLYDAAQTANRAAGESVKHLGTYVVKPEELS